MKSRTLLSLATSGRLRALASVAQLTLPFYRACFLKAAGSSGVLRLLADGPRPLSDLASLLDAGPDHHDALIDWLEVGVRVRVLKRTGAGYGIRGRLAQILAEAENDDVLALMEELVELHHMLIVDAPTRLKEGRPFELSDQDGKVIARSSRTLESFVKEAIDGFVPKTGSPRLLEIGCGSGTYIRHAMARNPTLEVRGIDLQADVAELARRNLRAWGLDTGVAVEAGDIRELKPDAPYDLATLHNNIYYFPVEKRVELLKHVRSFLRPGGRILLTTACRGGSPATAVLSLWGSLTEGCGRLPEPDELRDQMRLAGFGDITAKNLLAPVEHFFSFSGART